MREDERETKRVRRFEMGGDEMEDEMEDEVGDEVGEMDDDDERDEL